MTWYAHNVTLKSVPQAEVAAYFRGPDGDKDAFYIAPVVNDCTVVAGREWQEGRSEDFWNGTQALSRHFGCDALAYLNWDNSITEYRLFQGGDLIDSYLYNNYGGDGSTHDGIFALPEGGNAALLCKVFGVENNAEQVETVLRGRCFDDDYDPAEDPAQFAERDRFVASGGVLFAEETNRHEALARLLNLPPFVSWYEYQAIADTPDDADDIDGAHMIHVP